MVSSINARKPKSVLPPRVCHVERGADKLTQLTPSVSPLESLGVQPRGRRELSLIKHLLCARHGMDISSLQTARQVSLLPPIYRQGNGDSEGLSNMLGSHSGRALSIPPCCLLKGSQATSTQKVLMIIPVAQQRAAWGGRSSLSQEVQLEAR